MCLAVYLVADQLPGSKFQKLEKYKIIKMSDWDSNDLVPFTVDTR